MQLYSIWNIFHQYRYHWIFELFQYSIPLVELHHHHPFALFYLIQLYGHFSSNCHNNSYIHAYSQLSFCHYYTHNNFPPIQYPRILYASLYFLIFPRYHYTLIMLQEQIQISEVNYQICGEIGEGGVGHVFVVRDKLGRKYALKVIKEYGRYPNIRSMVDQEIKMQERFSGNPHIIQLIAYKEQNKKMYIVFQLGTCSLRNRMTMEQHLPLNEFIDIALDVTKGLAAIHTKNLIHRDIKPENIICVQRTYKITDFGSLQQGGEGEQRIGTPLYLPPEMLEEEECKYDQKIDVWSLGVSLFQAYFRIHPFYYSKEPSSVRQVYRQMRQNIAALTPGFTIQKLLERLQDAAIRREECESIRNKVLVTPEPILQQFQYFFQTAKDRPDIQYFAAVFQSLQQSIRDSKVRKSRVTAKQQAIPSDIRFYIDTINLFYELCAGYGNQKMAEIEFHLQLGMWYWNFFNYLGEKYVEYTHLDRLKNYKKDKETLWMEVQSALFDYWLYLSSNLQLNFFPQLSQLKIRILICGGRYKIYKGLQKFLQKITSKVGMQIKHLQELETMLGIFQVAQLRRIEEILVNDYYG